ncbi:MAG: hypothetical protein WC376_02660 [Candidatus Nanoarchaeia archaeon]|jgi:hypothetical protein
MVFKEISGITHVAENEIYVKSISDLDEINSNLKFFIKKEDGTEEYYVFKDDFVYKFPDTSNEDFPEDKEENIFYGNSMIKKAREMSIQFLTEKNITKTIDNYVLEEYLINKNIEFDEKIFNLILKMINNDISELRDSEFNENTNLNNEKEKEYINLLMNTAKIINSLPEYSKANSEMAKTLVIKKYVHDNDIKIRNKNTYSEIKALIQTYFE